MSNQDRDRTKSQNRAELDDFWDIERLLPERKSPRVPPRTRATPATVEIELTAPADKSAPPADAAVAAVPLTYTPETVPTPLPSPVKTASGEAIGTHYVPPHTADENGEETPLLDYRPAGLLLHRVQVFAWASGFHYFDQFAKDAAEYAEREASPDAKRESFFSYFPQYVQMNRRQLAWYLWWRQEVRNGRFPETDYAYILLYIFELINLDAAEATTARRRRDSMAAVWMAYRRTYPQLDHYMCEWLCDYCLIHHLPAPLDILSPALDAIIQGSRLKEFYLVSVITVAGGEHTSGSDSRDLITARILLRHCCQYDYRKSKFAGGEHKALFDKTIPAAVASVLPLLLGGNGHPPAITMQDSTVTRDAYTGALCSYKYKRKITVAYTSFSRSHDLRFLIGDMVKHVENRLRGWIGVRSKLSVMSLPIPLRDALDAYLNPLAPTRAPAPPKKKEVVRPDYEALYDLPDKPLSLADAAAIEADSWETTRILTEAFGGEEGEPVAPLASVEAPESRTDSPISEELSVNIPVSTSADAPTATPAASSDTADVSPLAAALGDLMPFLRAALDGDRDAQRAYAAAHRKMSDAIADEINAITAEIEIFDMVLEDDGDGFYAVIEDYRAILQSI